MQYRQAKDIAIRILKTLDEYCDKIDIVGNIRMEKCDTDTVDVICLPIKSNDKIIKPFFYAMLNLGLILTGNPLVDTSVSIDLGNGLILNLCITDDGNYEFRKALLSSSENYQQKIKKAWNEKADNRTNFETEWDFFHHLGIQWIPASERN